MNTAIYDRLTTLCAKPISQCENKELYSALLKLVQQEADMHLQPVTGRKLYYISAEFLIGFDFLDFGKGFAVFRQTCAHIFVNAQVDQVV